LNVSKRFEARVGRVEEFLQLEVLPRQVRLVLLEVEADRAGISKLFRINEKDVMSVILNARIM
jgi:hypothetical protein